MDGMVVVFGGLGFGEIFLEVGKNPNLDVLSWWIFFTDFFRTHLMKKDPFKPPPFGRIFFLEKSS